MRKSDKQSETGGPVYLDNAAAEPLLPITLRDHAERCRRYFYNPHSTHRFSDECMQQILHAEHCILDCLDIPPSDADIIWTSGGTEANNVAILGCLTESGACACAVEQSAHHSVLEPCHAFAEHGNDCLDMPVDKQGALVLNSLPETDRTAHLGLVALCHVNNVTGVVQDIAAVRTWIDAHAPRAYLLVDALQSFGKRPIPWQGGAIDLLAIGGRKIGGPPHVGALVVRKGTPLRPLFFGGGQQNGLRPGTMDTVGIMEFALAARHVCGAMKQNHEKTLSLNTYLRRQLRDWNGPTPVFVTPADASPYIASLGFSGYEGAVVMRLLGEKNIIVATGSACSASTAGLSHVITAMNLPRELARAAIRISFGYNSTRDDVDRLLKELRAVLEAY